MEAIISRPVAGAKSLVAKKAAAKQKPPLTPSRSEGDELTLKAAETLQALAANVIYDYDSKPREMNNSHLDEIEHLLGRLLDPSDHERDPLDPEDGDILAHLGRIAEEWQGALEVLERGIPSETVPVQVFLAAVTSHAVDLAKRIAQAYKGLPGTLEELRALTTFAGAKPYRDRPSPPIRRSPAVTSNPQTSPLYPLIRAWSEKINRIFATLETAEQSLKAESPNSPALPLLGLSLDQLRDSDEGFELLNAAAGLNPDPAPGAMTAPHRYTQEQLTTVLETIAGHASTLGRTLMQLQQCPENKGDLLTVLVDAAQLYADLIGSIADDAAGGVIIGDFNRWFHGPNFAKKGGAV